MHRILCTTDPINPTKWKNVKGREACQIGRTQQKDESSQIKFTALNAAHADLCLCIIQVKGNVFRAGLESPTEAPVKSPAAFNVNSFKK